MFGGCASWAIAFWRENPHTRFLVETEYDEDLGEETLLHVRVHDDFWAWDAIGREPLAEIEGGARDVSYRELLAWNEQLARLYGIGIIDPKEIEEARGWISTYYNPATQRKHIVNSG